MKQSDYLINTILDIQHNGEFTRVDLYGDDIKIEGVLKDHAIKIRIRSRADALGTLSGHPDTLKYDIHFGGEIMIGNHDIDPAHYVQVKGLVDEANQLAEAGQKKRSAELWDILGIDFPA